LKAIIIQSINDFWGYMGKNRLNNSLFGVTLAGPGKKWGGRHLVIGPQNFIKFIGRLNPCLWHATYKDYLFHFPVFADSAPSMHEPFEQGTLT